MKKSKLGFTGKSVAAVIAKYAVTFAVCAIAAYFIARYRGLKTTCTAALNCRYLSDGCFVAGIVATGIGAMTLIASTGFFDIFSYAFHSFLALFTALRSSKENGTYLDYKTMKAEKRKTSLGYIFATGIGFIAISILFLMFYYKLL